MSLFRQLRLREEQLHPLFREVRDGRGHQAARAMLDLVFSEYSDKDGNFIRDFQTTGFSARVWELSLFAYFYEEGLSLEDGHQTPDYLLEGVAVEAVTNQPAVQLLPPDPVASDAALKAHATMNASGAIPEFRRQLTKAIRAKVDKRFRPDGEPYWELPQVRDRAFVIAVQSFYGDTSHMFTSGIATELLLGDTETPGLFDDQELEHVAAILFSNGGTVGQFNRIGTEMRFGLPDVTLIRSGFCLDHRPDATEPVAFGYVVGSKGSPREPFSQPLTLIHNPRAIQPLDPGALPVPTEIFRTDHGIVPAVRAGAFIPFVGKTVIIEPSS